MGLRGNRELFFVLPVRGRVLADLYTARGGRVARLMDGPAEAEENVRVLPDLPAGMYLLDFQNQGHRQALRFRR